MNRLTDSQKATLSRLLEKREQLLREEISQGLLRSSEEHHKDIAGMVSDAGDESVANMLADVDIASVDRDVQELREVESALERAKQRNFGECADCGALIDYQRLKAYPAALRCFACQSRRERGYAHEGTPSL